MNKIKMHLRETPFRAIERGEKTVEYRLNDEKRQNLKAGDVIEFCLVDSKEKLEREIISLSVFSNFAEMFKQFPPHDDNTDMSQYYSPEDELKYGAVAIELT